jgi:hypothetical protein
VYDTPYNHVKVKFALEEAMKAQSRDIVLLFLQPRR